MTLRAPARLSEMESGVVFHTFAAAVLASIGALSTGLLSCER